MTGGSASHSRRSPLLASTAPAYRSLALTKATLNGIEKIYNSIKISKVSRLNTATWGYGCHLQYVSIGWAGGGPLTIDGIHIELAWMKILSYGEDVVWSEITCDAG